MTVEQLIAQLTECDSTMLVMVSGYEDGYNDLLEVATMRVKLDGMPKRYYYGSHREITKGGVECIFLG